MKDMISYKQRVIPCENKWILCERWLVQNKTIKRMDIFAWLIKITDQVKRIASGIENTFTTCECMSLIMWFINVHVNSWWTAVTTCCICSGSVSFIFMSIYCFWVIIQSHIIIKYYIMLYVSRSPVTNCSLLAFIYCNHYALGKKNEKLYLSEFKKIMSMS